MRIKFLLTEIFKRSKSAITNNFILTMISQGHLIYLKTQFTSAYIAQLKKRVRYSAQIQRLKMTEYQINADS